MNCKLLRDKMALHGDSDESLARALGLSYQTMRNRFTGHTPFKLAEVSKIASRYKLSANEIKEIFF